VARIKRTAAVPALLADGWRQACGNWRRFTERIKALWPLTITELHRLQGPLGYATKGPVDSSARAEIGVLHPNRTSIAYLDEPQTPRNCTLHWAFAQERMAGIKNLRVRIGNPI